MLVTESVFRILCKTTYITQIFIKFEIVRNLYSTYNLFCLLYNV
jgi:hypothetical protein